MFAKNKRKVKEEEHFFFPPVITQTFPTAFILGCAKTDTGKFDGKFANIEASTLGSDAITAALLDSGIEAEDVDEVIMGQVLTSGQGINPVRQAANSAGIPLYIPAYGVNMHFGSGLKAIGYGMHTLASRDAQIVVCGGQDSYSQSHFSGLIRSKKLPKINFKENIFSDVLVEPYRQKHIVESATQIAQLFRVTRLDQDLFAMQSHFKAKAASEVDSLLAPLFVSTINDETVNPNISIELLQLYPPCYQALPQQQGTVTLGNVSQYGDGASALVLCGAISLTPERYKKAARIVSYVELSAHTTGGDIVICTAIKKAIADAQWTPSLVDLYEIVEDSAALVLTIIKKLKIKRNKVNVLGGAIATGNTIGDASSKAVVTLMRALKQIKGKRGIAASTAGAGMAIAMCIELCYDDPFPYNLYKM